MCSGYHRRHELGTLNLVTRTPAIGIDGLIDNGRCQEMSTAGIAVSRTSDPHEARRLVATVGAAILTGQERPADESWTDYGARLAREVLGEQGVQVVPQFEASVASGRRGQKRAASRPLDDAFHRRLHVGADEDLWLHNDGYAVGDQAPDQLFLLCQQPAQQGGANVLIDTAVLLEEIAAQDSELHHFLLTEPIDQSEPAFDVVHAPVVRTLPSGRVQVRRNPYQAPLLGSPEWHAEMLQRWESRCVEAAASAPGATLRAGELACFDNYRVLHGRRPYVGDERTAHSIWAWTTAAVDVLPLERELVF